MSLTSRRDTDEQQQQQQKNVPQYIYIFSFLTF